MKILCASLLLAAFAHGCSGGSGAGGGGSPSATPTSTATPTATPSPTPDPTPAPLACSPAGAWTVTDAWASGGCGITGSLADDFTVTSSGGWTLAGNPAALYNSGGGCVVTSTAQLTALNASGSVQAGDSTAFYYHLTLTGTVVGGGGKLVDQTHPCTNGYTSTGTGP